MNIAAITSAYATQATQATSRSTSSATAANIASTPARLELPPLEIPTREGLDRETASFAQAVGKKFREVGIQVPPDPVLGSDAQGYVTVVNGHPDKAKIEQLFKDNPELRDQYAKISAGESLQRAGQGYDEFSARYDRLQGNLGAQKALVEARIAHNSQPFYMTLTATGGEGFFGGLAGTQA